MPLLPVKLSPSRSLPSLTVSFTMPGNSAREFILENFYPIFSVIQFLWNLSFHVVFLVLLYKVISSLKRNFAAINREFSHVQTLFLFVPGIIGLCFSIMLRSILYTYNESHIGFLMDEYPETRFLIPLISGLCLISILFSAVI